MDQIEMRLSRPRPMLISLVLIACTSCQESPTRSTPLPIADSRPTTITGLVRDTVLRPISNARVDVLDGALTGASTTTNDEGRFVFMRAVPAGDRVTLQISKEGYSSATPRVRADASLLITLMATTLVDLEGTYIVSFIAAPSCTQLPAAVQRRSYAAGVRSTASSP